MVCAAQDRAAVIVAADAADIALLVFAVRLRHLGCDAAARLAAADRCFHGAADDAADVAVFTGADDRSAEFAVFDHCTGGGGAGDAADIVTADDLALDRQIFDDRGAGQLIEEADLVRGGAVQIHARDGVSVAVKGSGEVAEAGEIP